MNELLDKGRASSTDELRKQEKADVTNEGICVWKEGWQWAGDHFTTGICGAGATTEAAAGAGYVVAARMMSSWAQ